MRTFTGLALLALVAGLFVAETASAQGIPITPALIARVSADCKDVKSAKCQTWIKLGSNVCKSDAKKCPSRLDQLCKANLPVCKILAPSFCVMLDASLKKQCNTIAVKYIKDYKPLTKAPSGR